MDRKHINTLILEIGLVVVIFILSFFGQKAFAAVPEQLGFSDYVAGQWFGSYYGMQVVQTLGSGWSGSVSALTIYAQGSGIGGPISSNPYLRFFECSDATYTSCTAIVSTGGEFDVSSPFGPSQITATFPTFSFNPSLYYFFKIYNDSSGSTEPQIYGTSGDSFPEGSVDCSISGQVCYPSNAGSVLGDIYFSFTSESDTTRINIISPPPDTASTTFQVDFEYYLNSNYNTDGVYTHILFQLCPLSYPSDPCVESSFTPLVSDALTQASTTLATPREGYHLLIANYWNGISTPIDCPWWNIFCSEESVEIGLGSSVNFNVATTTIAADVPPWLLGADFCGSFDGIIDAALCNGIAFLFIPSENTFLRFQDLQDLLVTKQPWGFFALINKKMTESISATSSVGQDIVVYTTAVGSTTVFSWNQAKDSMAAWGFDKPGIINIFLYFIWIYFMWQIWRILFFNQDNQV